MAGEPVHALSESEKLYQRAKVAVLYYRGLPGDGGSEIDREAAAVAADACEEAGFHVDAAWYRITAGIQSIEHRPEGERHMFGVASNLLPETSPLRIGDEKGNG